MKCCEADTKAVKLAKVLEGFTHSRKTSYEKQTLTNKDAVLMLMLASGPEPIQMKVLVEAMNLWRFGRIEMIEFQPYDWRRNKRLARRLRYAHDFNELFSNSNFIGGHVGANEDSTQTTMRFASRIVPTFWYRSSRGHYALTKLAKKRITEIWEIALKVLVVRCASE